MDSELDENLGSFGVFASPSSSFESFLMNMGTEGYVVDRAVLEACRNGAAAERALISVDLIQMETDVDDLSGAVEDHDEALGLDWLDGDEEMRLDSVVCEVVSSVQNTCHQLLDVVDVEPIVEDFQWKRVECQRKAAKASTYNQFYHNHIVADMWSGMVLPLLEPIYWEVHLEIQNILCLPLDKQKQAGRRRESRFVAGSGCSKKYSRCERKGHNFVTCTTFMPDFGVTPDITPSRQKKHCSLCGSVARTKRKCLRYVV